METIYRPMTKQFSYIQGLQPSYTLVYSMDPCGAGGVLADFMPHGLSSFDG